MAAPAALPPDDARSADDPPRDAPAELATLAARGADRHDPTGFHFLEALARRRRHYQGTARQRLDDTLARALADFAARFDASPNAVAPDAAAVVATPASPPVSRPTSPLTALLRDLAARPGHEDAAGPDAPSDAAPLPDLKSLDYFRDSWAQLSVEQQLAQAMAQAPDNAGPLNSHLLILRALQRMHDISPDYLHRFIAYADTLVWLDQATGGSLPSSRPVVRDSERTGEAAAESRRKPTRARKRPAPGNR